MAPAVAKVVAVAPRNRKERPKRAKAAVADSTFRALEDPARAMFFGARQGDMMPPGHTPIDNSPAEQSFESRLDALTPELRGYLRARTDRAQADDVVQTALLRALEKKETLREPKRLRAWLFQIARHALIDLARHNSRQVAEAHLEPASPDEYPSPCACASNLVNDLAPAQAEMVRLVDLEEKTLGEAAQEVGTTVNNATVRLHRARKKLRDELEELCGAIDYRSAASCECGSDKCD